MLERNNAVIKLSRRKSDFCPFYVLKCIVVLVYSFNRFHSKPFNIQPDYTKGNCLRMLQIFL